jgi:hypothetical protein
MTTNQKIKFVICVIGGIPAGIILYGLVKNPSSFSISENLIYLLSLLSMIFLFIAYSKKK